MGDDLVKILDGNTFVVSDGRGDIDASPADPTGLFSYDTRFLSRWILKVNGQRLNPLSVDDLSYFETRFFVVPSTESVYADARLSVMRQRATGGGFREELRIFNHSEKPVDVSIRIEAAADFADLFEVKDAPVRKKGRYYTRVERGWLLLGYERETYTRETTIASSAPAHADEGGLSFVAHVEPHGTWTTELRVTPALLNMAGTELTHSTLDLGAGESLGTELDAWLRETPVLRSDWEPLRITYRRALIDLAALRFSTAIAGPRSLPAAGLPWYMTMFGRDSIFTSLQALPFVPSTTSGTRTRARSCTRCGTAS
jgi:glycogen debranching enzyme